MKEFFEKHPEFTESQKNISKAMLLSGASEIYVEGAVKGYNSRRNEDNSLTCPRCSGGMKVVTLADGRKAKYCQNDRVVMPFLNMLKK